MHPPVTHPKNFAMMIASLGVLILALLVLTVKDQHPTGWVNQVNSDSAERHLPSPAWKPENFSGLTFGVDSTIFGSRRPSVDISQPITEYTGSLVSLPAARISTTNGISTSWAGGPAAFPNALGPGVDSVDYGALSSDFPVRFEPQVVPQKE
jgi:hypothetical protein